jgi:hypothetical protein
MARAFSGSLKSVNGSLANTLCGVRGWIADGTLAIGMTLSVYGNC